MEAKYSVVIPIFNEQDVLAELYQRIRVVMDDQEEPWEMILVDDGSIDQSARIIGELHQKDERVKGISFSRNFGFQEAVTAGLAKSQGDAVILADADLQDPPEVFPMMLAKWREGYDVVYGIRTYREGETRFKKLTAKKHKPLKKKYIWHGAQLAELPRAIKVPLPCPPSKPRPSKSDASSPE